MLAQGAPRACSRQPIVAPAGQQPLLPPRRRGAAAAVNLQAPTQEGSQVAAAPEGREHSFSATGGEQGTAAPESHPQQPGTGPAAAAAAADGAAVAAEPRPPAPRRPPQPLAAGTVAAVAADVPLAPNAVPASSDGRSLADNAGLLLQAAQQTAARLWRQLEPPPPGFPPGPSGDAAVQLLQQPLPFLDELRRRYGTVVGLLLGGERVVLVAEPEVARAVLVDPGQPVFVKTGTAFFPGSSLTGNGLLVSDGEVWRRQRRLANPAFRRAAVEKYAEAMLSATAGMLRASWRDGVARDVYAEFNRLTLRITLEALFGARLAAGDEQAGRDITGAIQDAFRFFAQRGATAMVIPEFVPTPDNLLFGAAVARLDRAVYGLIAERRRELAQAPRPPRDLLDSLLLSADESGEGMGDQALRDELLTLLVAGQETSAILLAWACAYLAHHPGAQAAAAAEVQRVLGGRPLQAADARQLQYVEAVVLEAMRLSPPAYLMGRCAAQATSLAGYYIPAGTTLLVCPHLMHRDPAWWGPDASAFRPERWLELQQRQQQHEGSGGGGGGFGMSMLTGMGPNGAYVPFGAGQRNCIGSGFAMMEAVLVLAAVLQQYQVQPLPGAAFPQAVPQITLRPDSVRLLLRRR